MMRFSILFFIITLCVFTSCDKGKYTTKPQISIKSINKTSLVQNDVLTMQVEFTDAEGDVQDTLWIRRISKVCPTQIGIQFTSKEKIPDFVSTPNQKGIFEISYAYNNASLGFQSIGGCSSRIDTSTFKFWMKDKAKNFSDTITTQNIIFLR